MNAATAFGGRSSGTDYRWTASQVVRRGVQIFVQVQGATRAGFEWGFLRRFVALPPSTADARGGVSA
jgi:hypothetical protein